MSPLLNLGLLVFTFLGGIFPLIIPNWNNKYAQGLLAFSGSFLFAVCISHILPHSFTGGDAHIAGILVVVGFFLQLILQRLTHGVEHGHDCNHHHNHTTAWSLFGGMAIHSFVEGLPLSIGYFEISTLIALYIAILLHKIPSAIIIVDLFQQGQNRKKSYFILALFSVVTPLGALVGYLIHQRVPGFEQAVTWVIPLIAGSFLQIATTIFYEAASKNHKITARNWVLISFGGLAGMCSGMFHVH